MDGRRHPHPHRSCARSRGYSQLLSSVDASTHERTHPCAGDDRHSWLEPQSHLSRHVCRLRGHRDVRPKRVGSDPHVASGNHDPLRRRCTRGGVPRTAVWRRLSGLQGARAPLAVAVGQERYPRRAGATPSETEVRSGLIAIGVLTLVLASYAPIPTPQEANDALLTGSLLAVASAALVLRSRAEVGPAGGMSS